MERIIHALADGASKPPAIDHDVPHRQPKKHSRNDRPSHGSTPGSVQNTIQATVAGVNIFSSASGDEEADGDVSGADVSEADEKDDEDDDGDSDALAPSDCAKGTSGHQAGRLTTEGERIDLPKYSRKHPGKNSKKPRHSRFSKHDTVSRIENLGSDDFYDGVDGISESAEEAPVVETKGEQSVVEPDEHGLGSLGNIETLAVAETSGHNFESYEGYGVDGPFFMSDFPCFDQQLGRTDGGILGSDTELFQATEIFDNFDPMPELPTLASSSNRRVHFREPLHLRSDSSDMVSDLEDLNTLFKPASGPCLAAGQTSTSEGGQIQDGDDGTSVGSSSGYETDYDETDDEDVPASATKSPHALLRHPSPSSLGFGENMDQTMILAGKSTAPSPFKVPSTPLRNLPGPRLGSFRRDPTKPCAMIDCTGDNMSISPAKRPVRAYGIFSQVTSNVTSTANSSPALSHSALPNPTYESEVDYSDYSSQVAADPMLAVGSGSMAEVLLPNKLHGFGSTMSTPSRSVFFPLEGMVGMSALYAADDQYDEEEDDDGEDVLDDSAFINWGDDSSDDGDAAAKPSMPTPNSISPLGISVSAQPKTPSPSNSAASELLAHFDKGVIGAFRQGQNQHQQQSHRPQGGSSLNRHTFATRRHTSADSPASASKKRRLSSSFAPKGSFAPSAKKRLMTHR